MAVIQIERYKLLILLNLIMRKLVSWYSPLKEHIYRSEMEKWL